MRRVRSLNTSPELAVRQLLHSCGYRFRLHVRNLPGKPDIVLPKHRIVVLVHGCFWHRHKNCKNATVPESNAAYWQNKFSKNVLRDRRIRRELRRLGWRVITVWECQVKRPSFFLRKIEKVASGITPYTASSGLVLPLAAEAAANYGFKPTKMR